MHEGKFLTTCRDDICISVEPGTCFIEDERRRCRSFEFPTWAAPGRSGESRGVDRDVHLCFAQLGGCLAVRPCRGPLVGYLDAGDVPIVTIVGLGGNAADRRIDKAQRPYQQAGIFIEVKLRAAVAGWFPG